MVLGWWLLNLVQYLDPNCCGKGMVDEKVVNVLAMCIAETTSS